MNIKLVTSNVGFRSFFWTQFLGAFNDNFFKNALVVLVAYRGVQLGQFSAEELVALAGGLFVLPFFIFSPLAGQISDKFDKHKIIRLTKIAEVIIMVFAGAGFYFENYVMLLVVLFLMGAQAAFFGPVKYSIIPELVEERDLTAGNAFIELGTFVAILLGTIAGGWVTAFKGADLALGAGLIAFAVGGYLTALGVPVTRIGDANLKIKYNPLPEFIDLYRISTEKKVISNSILGISWFWFFGAGILSVLPIYVKDYLHADEHVVTIFLTMFTFGIGIGSIICEKLSFQRVEIGLVPIGSLGMTLFLFDLYLHQPTWSLAAGQALSLSAFLEQDIAVRLLVDFFMMSVFGGLFILPLYTLLQDRSAPETRSRVIAANNIGNAIFMVGGSILVLIFYRLKLNTAQIFAVFSTLNVLVAVYIYTIVPEFTLRFYAWILSHILYRVTSEGRENIPKDGGCILAANHITFVDWVIVSGACKRPARFVMFYKFFDIPVVKILLKHAKVIPIAGAKEDPTILDKALKTIREELKEGEVVCIFPEGKLTSNGKLSPFKPGIAQMVKAQPVPVVPVVIEGLWGSIFSRKSDKDRTYRRRVKVRFLPPIPPEKFSVQELEKIFARELGESAAP